LIFILKRPPDAVSNILIDLKESGFTFLVLIVGEEIGLNLPLDIPWRRVRKAEDLAGGPLT
jgi:sporulation protein YlmC with PRC-barrel domain